MNKKKLIIPSCKEIESNPNQSPFLKEKALILQRDIFTSSPYINKLFANIIHSNIEAFTDRDDLADYLYNEKIDRIVFSNPYRNDPINKIYEYCRKTSFPMLVIERGCLPGTVFLDTGGFLLDSASYRREAWNKKPTSDQTFQLEQYITSYKNGLPSLEVQTDKPNASALKEKLMQSKKPIVLITLQMPSDTVTRNFAHEGRGYARFLEFMNDIVARLKDDYTFVYKPHPRAPELEVTDAISVIDMHIDEAITLSDAVVTFNSGTGILAFLHNKPVAIYGRAFYAGEGLTHQTATLDDLKAFFENLSQSFDANMRKRFLVHLLTNLLSDVHIISLPFWKQNVPVAIQYRTARFFNADNMQTVIVQQVEAENLIARKISSGKNLLWAIKRWLHNQFDELISKINSK